VGIPIKKKICKGCETKQFIFSKGLCSFCAGKNKPYSISRSTISLGKNKKPITKQTSKNKEKRKTERAGYGEFFQKMIQRIIDERICCENCGNQLTGHVSECAHIVSKSKHPEVATVEDNILFLCGLFSDNSCHANFDSSLSKRATLFCFSAAKEKYKLFKHLVTTYSKERSQLEDE